MLLAYLHITWTLKWSVCKSAVFKAHLYPLCHRIDWRLPVAPSSSPSTSHGMPYTSSLTQLCSSLKGRWSTTVKPHRPYLTLLALVSLSYTRTYVNMYIYCWWSTCCSYCVDAQCTFSNEYGYIHYVCASSRCFAFLESFCMPVPIMSLCSHGIVSMQATNVRCTTTLQIYS